MPDDLVVTDAAQAEIIPPIARRAWDMATLDDERRVLAGSPESRRAYVAPPSPGRSPSAWPASSAVRHAASWSLLLLHLCALAAAGDVRVVGDSCVLVDGKPFFPIGLYSAEDPADFPLIAEAGFNTVHTYDWETKRDFEGGKAWLDAAHKQGLKALVGLVREDVRDMDFEHSVRRVGELKGHPALLAWHTMDEPDWDDKGNCGRDYMPRAYEAVKRHDPDHPVTAVVCHFDDTKLFEPSVDVLQADYYPVPPIPPDWHPGTGMLGVKMFVDRWRTASGGKKPVWYVGQIFDFSFIRSQKFEIPKEWRRLPTGEEVRCMTYTAVASGARGVLYWSLKKLIRDEWNRALLPRVKLWEDLREVVGELNALMPLLTATTPETRQDRDGVVAMVKSDGQAVYLVAANYERKPTETTVGVPGVGNAIAKVAFGEGQAEIVDGKLRLSLLPLETRVLRIDRGQN